MRGSLSARARDSIEKTDAADGRDADARVQAVPRGHPLVTGVYRIRGRVATPLIAG
jgi:hypothetical protein